MSNPLSRMAQSFMLRKPAPQPEVEDGLAQPSASPAEPLPHIDHDGRPDIRPDDQLNLFRLLAGITSHPSMVHSHLSGGGRAAPNLGIYARVVHNEQDAKRGYKRFSWLINSCLGLQIIVAASLTAMGAAGANHSAVTVFGAINTVIAGVLTFLKGSGLPNRLKYYQSEWKWVREFIEQRERDFSRPGCVLNVYAVVEIVEKMYEDVKKDLEASVPDRFAGFRSGQKSVSGTNGDTRPGSVILSRLGTEGLSDKLKEMESGFGSRVKNLVSDITHQSHVAQAAQGAARDIQERTKTFSDDAAKELREYQEQAEHLRDDTVKELRVQVDQIGQLEDQARTIGEVATKGLNEQVEWTHQLGERTRTIGEDATKKLGKEVERAEHIENNFLVKLKDLRSEIGNRAHLAQEAMSFLQEAFHHGDSHETGERVEDHHAG
jgi:hypothetical protein